MTSDDEFKQDLKTFIPIENLVTKQIDRIMTHKSVKNWEFYEESIEALIDLLDPATEKEVIDFKKKNDVEYNLSYFGVEKYTLLFRFIKQHLANDNIIWKKSRGYERGSD